jgi:hypothetical protein
MQRNILARVKDAPPSVQCQNESDLRREFVGRLPVVRKQLEENPFNTFV